MREPRQFRQALRLRVARPFCAFALAFLVLLVAACSGPPAADSSGAASTSAIAAPTQEPSGSPSTGSPSAGGSEGQGEGDTSDPPGEADPSGTGEASNTDPSEAPEPAPPTATGTPDISLRVVVDPFGPRNPEAKEARSTARLVCRGTQPLAGSDVPDPVAACAYALHPRGLMATPPKPPPRTPARGQRCTEIYGGDSVATVSGTVQGKHVTRRYTLRNGCEMSQWEAASSLVGDAGDPHAME
ncbi:hypothetical protein [Galactobacter caseinivorans]|uniref:Subtilisin inhibitor domain-containing protein n=1 Tax=Galactobacter caseinivorans TaxID=2676123 RepID=A0A496PHP9_9MICC|nr:hypothetical protein [Galactobacter caseinivorans]RKW70013.1 hypothetical protein DWQ67_11185 [Galactobacter caseinivorans]